MESYVDAEQPAQSDTWLHVLLRGSVRAGCHPTIVASDRRACSKAHRLTCPDLAGFMCMW